MQLIPGGSLIFSFDVESATGTPVSFDASPAVVLTFQHNGVADTGWTSYSMTDATAGNYDVSTTIPSGYVLGDYIACMADGYVGGVEKRIRVFAAQLKNTPDNATVVAIASGALTAVAGAVWNALLTGYSVVGSFAAWVKSLLPASTAVVLPTTPPTGYATSTAQTNILNAVNAITTNVARVKMVLPTFMARPSTGSSVYAINVYLYNLEGHLEDADTNTITIAAANAAGGSLNTGLSSTTMTRVSAGLYTVNYTVNSTDATGEAIFSIAWAVGGVAMASAMASMIEDAESLATLAAIEAKTNLIATNAGDSPNAVTAQGTISTLASTTATATAAKVLINPTYPLLTNSNGLVEFSNPVPTPLTATQTSSIVLSVLPADYLTSSERNLLDLAGSALQTSSYVLAPTSSQVATEVVLLFSQASPPVPSTATLAITQPAVDFEAITTSSLSTTTFLLE